jgi:hypothetical protein
MTASAKNHHDMRITEAKIDMIGSDLGDRLYALVTLEDGSKRRLLDVPAGRLYLEPRSVAGRTFASAYAQAMCWLEAADTGLHRIVEVEKMGPIDEDDPERRKLNRNWEVRVRMSDGASVRAIAFYSDEVGFEEGEFLDLSLEQAFELKIQRDKETGWNGLMTPDYSKVHQCLLCSRRH